MNTYLLFALVFIPFGWFTVQALRFTDRSIGGSSPLKTVVRYQIAAWQHFMQCWLLLWLLLGVILVPLPFIVIYNLKTAASLWPYVLTLFTVIVTGWFLYQLFVLVQLHRRYWQLLKGVVLTFHPGSKTIHVERYGLQTQLNANTVDQIEHHFTDLAGSKLFQGYNYYKFIGFDGRVTVLGSGSPFLLYFAVDDYFKNVPRAGYSHKIPWPPALSTVLALRTLLTNSPF